jgi:hypothetical protein
LLLFDFSSSVFDVLFLPCYRVILLWLHVPHFLKKGPLSPKSLLPTPKPLRLPKIKAGTELRVHWRGAIPLSRVPQLNLKNKVKARRGNAQRT